MSANNSLPMNQPEMEKSQASVETKKQDSAEEKQMLRSVCAVYHATCTSASTCFEVDTFEEFVDVYYTWGNAIQNNYCMYDSPFRDF